MLYIKRKFTFGFTALMFAAFMLSAPQMFVAAREVSLGCTQQTSDTSGALPFIGTITNALGGRNGALGAC